MKSFFSLNTEKTCVQRESMSVKKPSGCVHGYLISCVKLRLGCVYSCCDACVGNTDLLFGLLTLLGLGWNM